MSEVTDRVGKETLDVIGSADNFNLWMFETIQPFSKGKILEIGSGLGNISSFFLKKDNKLMLSDLREEYCTSLQKKFSSNPYLLGVVQMNLVQQDFDKVYKDHLETYDTVFALNVIEHIEDDNSAITNCKKLLKNGGHLIILVPSYQKLYNKFDEELGHFRRYTKKSLSDLFRKNNLEITHKQYFNCMGIFGWYLSGGILGRETIPSNQMQLYNKLVPIWKVIDLVVKNKIGLSTMVVGRK